MNPLIRELAEQAEILFYQGRINGYEYQGAEVTVEDLEKFAKLIVQNCIEKIKTTEVPRGNIPALSMVVRTLKQHFGVEE